jgi:APA family basic amino acid/polyamine antiporter
VNAPARKQIGFYTALALVMGNLIGSGVFLLPASLAPYGGASLVGWIISAGGAVLLALVFAHLARHMPVSGGPYAYTRKAFGDLAGFIVAWLYWLSICCGNAAIAIAFVGYLDPFIPGLGQSPAAAGALAIAALWVLIGVNVLGVREAGRVQVVTTLLKIVPLLLIGVAGWFVLEPGHFALPEPSERPVTTSVFATVALTMWAFCGVESATIPAGHVEQAERTIPRATIAGTIAAAVIYIVSTVGVMGVLPPETLQTSTAPFADAARAIFGGGAALLVAGGAAISTFGALNGWTLLMGQLPQAAAREGLFPAPFARDSRRGTPATGLVISGIIATALIAANYTRGLVGLFTFTILLATLGALVPYAFCALAGFLLKHDSVRRRSQAVISALAFVYVMCAIGGSGYETIFWGFLLMLAGLPFYVWVVRTRSKFTS